MVILFVLVLVSFSLAQEDSRKMEKINTGAKATTAARLLLVQDKPVKLQETIPASHPANSAE